MIRILLLCACLALLPGEEFELPGFAKQVVRDIPEHRIVAYKGMFIADGHPFHCEMYLDRINGVWTLQQSILLVKDKERLSLLTVRYEYATRTQSTMTVHNDAGLTVSYSVPGFVTPAGEEIGETMTFLGTVRDVSIEVNLRRNEHGVLLPPAR